MDTNLLNIIGSISPVGVMGLQAYIIWRLISVKKNTDTIKDNHQHELLEGLRRMEEKLDKMLDQITWIRARINGFNRK